ncbi:ABC transporter substrate-binding protein [Arhodomonas aquaeolei]|uniref:ABC transporter substrate-binding protein n=1 Tax=Arhodomonas aquaeolei TaxID=2369 RepID=UPI00216A502B|nr:ABC transporter substrate-binding protein [Arhodomonas aquaeolei]MCS4503793.1 ABC transporter substrate-binding protein [Arhodomonas aquaeolei]
MMTRFLLVMGLTLVLAADAVAALSDGELRIGFVSDMDGIYSDLNGLGSLNAAEMAIEDAGGTVAGAPVYVYVRDTELDPERGVRLARELHEQHGVDLIIGVTGSDVAVAVQEYADEQGIAIIHNAPATTDLTGAGCSRFGIQWGFDNYALAAATVSATMKEGGDRWFFITADYSWGYNLFDQASEFIEASDGEVVGNALAPYQGDDFSPQLAEAAASDADVIALGVAGADSRLAIRQAYGEGLGRTGRTVIAMNMYIADVRRLGLYVTSGLRFATSFYWNADEASRTWSQRFLERTGAAPTVDQAGTYSAVAHYLEGVVRTGSDDASTVLSDMRQHPVDDFYGRGGHIRRDGQMVHDMYLVRVKRPSESTRAWDYLDIVRTIPGKRAFRPLSQSECPLVEQ